MNGTVENMLCVACWLLMFALVVWTWWTIGELAIDAITARPEACRSLTADECSALAEGW